MTSAQFIDGVPVNPALPDRFFSTPLNGRPPEHLSWWQMPFVITCTHESWQDHQARMASYDDNAAVSRERWEHIRADWLKLYPDGVRYDVWALDGCAEDRPTRHGCYCTLEDALASARELRGLYQ